jgi:hypothetical protein
MLTSNGTLIASIPNISHYKILLDIIIYGRFEYKDEGILDRTHLRFFTIKSIKSMFDKTGYLCEIHPHPIKIRSPSGIANILTLGLFRRFLTAQYIVVATPRNLT